MPASRSFQPQRWTSGTNLDAAQALEPVLVAGRLVMIFGEPFGQGLGMHNVHQNQGDPLGSQGWDENGIRQDRATTARRPDGRFDVFLPRLSTQADRTDGDGHPAWTSPTCLVGRAARLTDSGASERRPGRSGLWGPSAFVPDLHWDSALLPHLLHSAGETRARCPPLVISASTGAMGSPAIVLASSTPTASGSRVAARAVPVLVT
ncbi:DUF2278 family protein [Streptomyces sp. NPDC054887]